MTLGGVAIPVITRYLKIPSIYIDNVSSATMSGLKNASP